MTLQLVREIVPEDLTIPPQARRLGIYSINLEIDEIDIHYCNERIEFPICQTLAKTYETLKEGCRLFGISFEVRQWIEMITKQPLERRFGGGGYYNDF